MAAVEMIKAAYAALGRNDPSMLFGLMDPAIAGTKPRAIRLRTATRTLVRRPWARECSGGC
jgi:hypothetical protein